MDSNRLMYFKAIAESESITKAASKLFISQPALSKSLTSLETELRCTLFNRVGRKLYLNSNGKRLLEYATKMHDLFGQIDQDFKKQSSRTLSICAVGNFFPFLLRDYFKEGIRPITLNIVPDAQVPEIMFSGEADIAVADDLYLKDDPNTGLRRITVLSEQLLLAVPKSHHLADKKSIKVTELENENIMRSTTSGETNNWLEKILEINKVKINWSMALDSETWRYYSRGRDENMPPSFESSSMFLTSMDLQRRDNWSFIKVEGAYTNRMIFIWFFEENREFLSEFLQSVKNGYR